MYRYIIADELSKQTLRPHSFYKRNVTLQCNIDYSIILLLHATKVAIKK
jgi:hypothetical protein